LRILPVFLDELFSLYKEEVWSELKFGVPKVKSAV
jgi:hypothetical protein